MVPTSLSWFPRHAAASQALAEGEQALDLDIRVVEYPLDTNSASGGSDYLTCKTDSTCDGSDAC